MKKIAQISLLRICQPCAGALLLALGVCAANAQSSHADRVASTKELRVCIWPDYYGISYRNPKTQQLEGVDIDLSQAFAKDLGVKLRYVDSSFSKLVEDLTQDHCDIAMFSIGITAARAEKLRFSHPYLVSDIYAITTRSNRRIKVWEDIDQAGVVVSVAKGTLHETVMRDKLKAATLSVNATPQGREQDVESGRADVFMTDYPFSRRMLEQTDWARLVRPSSTFNLTPYAYAVAAGDAQWLQRVDKFVADIKRDGRLAAAAKKNGLEPIVVRD